MHPIFKSYSLIALTAASLGLGACSTKDRSSETTSVNAAQQESSAGAQTPASSLLEDFVRSAGADRVFFVYDSYLLTDEGRDVLRRQAAWLIANPSVLATVEGHCDERGTREYNLGLGERRANTVRQFLESAGVARNRIAIVSYGKERPEQTGSGDDAWSKNRRGVTVVRAL